MKWLDGAVLLATISFVSYFLTYTYERGYLLAYDIPDSVISLTPFDVLSSAVGSLAIIALVFVYIIPFPAALGYANPVMFRAVAFGAATVGYMVMFFVYGNAWLHFDRPQVLILIATLISFGAIVAYGYYGIFKRRIQRGAAPRHDLDTISAYLSLTRPLVLAFTLVPYVASAAFLSGYRDGTKNHHYLLTHEGSRTFALIRSYGDVYVFRPVSIRQHFLGRDVLIIHFGLQQSRLLLSPASI
jgi:hypothetical protein